MDPENFTGPAVIPDETDLPEARDRCAEGISLQGITSACARKVSCLVETVASRTHGAIGGLKGEVRASGLPDIREFWDNECVSRS
jgi:hypothetical protein